MISQEGMGSGQPRRTKDAACRPDERQPRIQIAGVGSYGVGLLPRFSRSLGGRLQRLAIDSIVMHSDRRNARVIEIPVDRRGMLCGPSRERVSHALDACVEEVRAAAREADVALIVAGLGEAVPDIVAPWFARIYRDCGVCTRAAVVMPHAFLSRRVAEQAHCALEELRATADTVLAVEVDEGDFPGEDLNMAEYWQLVEDRLLLAAAALAADLVPRIKG